MAPWSFKHLRGTAAAAFSPCGRYRYRLDRRWDHTKPALVIVGLNPSVAGVADDPTIRKEVWFAHLWGCGAIIKVNLFAIVSTDPKLLPTFDDPNGIENDATIRQAFASAKDRGSRLLLAWGKAGELHGRGAIVARWARDFHGAPECFGRCKNGHPLHPLYLPYALQPQPYLTPTLEVSHAS